MTGGPTARVFRGEVRVDAIAPDDRGLAYGDGLFETLRAHRGELPWWGRHWARLQGGAIRLRFSLPPEALVREQAAALLDGADAVLRLQVTRGPGGRGYAPAADAPPGWTISRHPLPAPPPADGLRLRWCATRLALQPALAGIKHCNRLEQVLARAEWTLPGGDRSGADEGLMRDTAGDVVCATASNLFVLHGERWRTPPVDRCGVAGIARGWLLEQFDIEQAALLPADVESADAVVLSNAVRGILPVACLGERAWSPHPATGDWRRALAAAHPGFAPA